MGVRWAVVLRLISGFVGLGGSVDSIGRCIWVGTSIVYGGCDGVLGLFCAEAVVSGDGISSNWNELCVRIGDWEVSERNVLSEEDPAKLSRAYLDGRGRSGVVMVLTELWDDVSLITWARGGLGVGSCL